MARIWQDIEIDWQDETYTVRPTLEFINHLEQRRGASLTALFLRLQSQDMPSALACDLIAKTLQFAGAEVTAEDVFAETGGVGGWVLPTVQTIILACMPPAKTTSGAPSDVKKKKVTSGKRKTPRSTGKNSTA